MNSIAISDTLVPTHFPRRAKSVQLHIKFENDPDKMTPDEFWDFCQENSEIRAELTKEGDVIIMPPTGFETSNKNAEITTELRIWARKGSQGKITDSNGGFILPNGATRAPDATWTSNARLEKFSSSELKKFLPLCPDFIIELRSESDDLQDVQNKMDEYIENGALLGWLIDPLERKVHIYKPNEVKILDDPKTVSGEGIMSGFDLDMTEIL